MFEKEAEEYGNEYWDSLVDCDDKGMLQEAYKDGAEFGYNKAFVEADKNLKAVVADFNKANEWHYVKDELPPIKKEYNGRSELVLVLSKEKEMQYAQYVEKEKTWARGICEINFKPYAWKEIVLPKESK